MMVEYAKTMAKCKRSPEGTPVIQNLQNPHLCQFLWFRLAPRSHGHRQPPQFFGGFFAEGNSGETFAGHQTPVFFQGVNHL